MIVRRIMHMLGLCPLLHSTAADIREALDENTRAQSRAVSAAAGVSIAAARATDRIEGTIENIKTRARKRDELRVVLDGVLDRNQ
jgi:hypothetical protein